MSDVLKAIGYIIGMGVVTLIDIVVFCTIAAMPLAALVYLGIISQGLAMGLLAVVAVLATLRVIIVGAINAV